MNPEMAQREMSRRKEDPTYWRNGGPLFGVALYPSHAGRHQVRCNSLGELLLAIALDPDAPIETDVVDR
ncbi:MAG TPA: hypothetical protein VGR26_12310 [Acidimicrobiales bacterium]|nr:hypothetical protein [Acidimicrobiales bacterium]